MKVLVILFIYLIGVVLAYMRCLAAEYEIEEDYIHSCEPKFGYITRLCFLSWISFLAGVIIFFTE